MDKLMRYRLLVFFDQAWNVVEVLAGAGGVARKAVDLRHDPPLFGERRKGNRGLLNVATADVLNAYSFVTHVSGTKCHLCLRPHTEAWLTAKCGQETRASSTTAQREALHRQIAEGLRRTCDPQLRHSPFLLGSLHAALVMLLGAAIAREIIAGNN